MASFTQTHRTTWSDEGQTLQAIERSFTDGGRMNLEVVIPAEETDRLVWAAIPPGTAIKALQITANGALTLYSNDAAGGSPDDTINLPADASIEWTEDDDPDIKPFPFTAAFVSRLYVDNDTLADVTLRINVLFVPLEPSA